MNSLLILSIKLININIRNVLII